jgi:hypothetical protein
VDFTRISILWRPALSPFKITLTPTNKSIQWECWKWRLIVPPSSCLFTSRGTGTTAWETLLHAILCIIKTDLNCISLSGTVQGDSESPNQQSATRRLSVLVEEVISSKRNLHLYFMI